MCNKEFKTYNLLLSLTIIILCNCSRNNEDYSIIEKNIPEVTTIEIYDDINVILFPDSIYKVKIYAIEEIISNIKIDTANGSLHIKNKNKHNWLHYSDSITVEVLFGNKLGKIHTHGTGKIISLDTIKTNYIRFYAFNGAGEFNVSIISNSTSVISHSYTTTDFFISGKTNQLSSTARGMGKIKLENLKSNNARIIYNGTNEYFVNAINELNIEILNIGNVYYKGNPEVINIKKTGKGELVLLE